MREVAGWVGCVLLIVAVWAIMWFVADSGWFSTPDCDPHEVYDHCEQVTGPGPGNGR